MNMSLDEQLAELLGQLGVVLEGTEAEGQHAAAGEPHICAGDERGRPEDRATREVGLVGHGAADVRGGPDVEVTALAEVSLFQTSREHYGVFYRLDLVAGAPQLRVYAPDEEGALKMRCYLVRPSLASPLRAWFAASRDHEGSAAYEEMRETTEQHLLFAAGETLKRLFWAGEHNELRFPTEISVQRVA
jgi:hypothetical protein